MTEKTLTYDFEKYEALLKQEYIIELIPMIHQIIHNIDDLLLSPNKTCQSINRLTNYYIFLNFITKFLEKNEEFFNLRDNVTEIRDEIDALKNFERNLYKYLKTEMTKDLYILYPEDGRAYNKKDDNFSYTSTFLRILEYMKIPILNMALKHFCIEKFYNILEDINKKGEMIVNGNKLIKLLNFLEEFINISKSTKQKSIESCSKDFTLLKNFLDHFSLILFSNKDLINIYEVYLENLKDLRIKDEINIKDLKESENYDLIEEIRNKYTFRYEINKLTCEKILKQFIEELKKFEITTDLDTENIYLNILVNINNYEITKFYIEKEFSYIYKSLKKMNNYKNSEVITSLTDDINTPFNPELFKLIDDYFKKPSSQLIFQYLNRDRLSSTKYSCNKNINKIYIKVTKENYEKIFKTLNSICKRLSKKLEYSIIRKELETYYDGIGDIIYSLNREYKE